MVQPTRSRWTHIDDSWPLPLDRPFTSGQARAEGVRAQHLRRLVLRGALRHLVKGVYVVAGVPDTIALRCAALSIVVPDDCVVVDRHAGWLLGANMILAPNEHLELLPISMYRPSGRGRLRNDLSVSGERNLSRSDVIEMHGVPVTTPIRTAWDLGRVRWPSHAITGLDSMLGLGAFTRAELVAGVERLRGCAG